jgi:hypothetical protein
LPCTQKNKQKDIFEFFTPRHVKWILICGLKLCFIFQFFDVAEVAIIHKKIHPELVRKKKYEKKKSLSILLYFWLPTGTLVWILLIFLKKIKIKNKLKIIYIYSGFSNLKLRKHYIFTIIF